MKKIILAITGFLFCGLISNGQDAHLSQFYASPMSLNPAITGMGADGYSARLLQRTQWRKVASKPFLTEIASFDMPYERFGYGIYFLNSTAGEGRFNEFYAIGSGAFRITEENKRYNLTCGLQMGIIHKSVNVSKLSFGEQYDPVTGDFNDAYDSGETFDRNSKTMFDLNFGAYYYNYRKMDLFEKSYRGSPFTDFPYYAGFSIYHLTQPKETLYGQKNRLNRKYIGHAGSLLRVHKSFAVEPGFLYMRQAKNNEYQFGVLAYYYLNMGKDNYFFALGPYYRVKDALAIHVGVMYKGFELFFSYDINTSGLREVSNGRGGFEISLSYSGESQFIALMF